MTQQTCDLLLTGGTVVTADDEWRVLDPGAVAVTGSVITAVGTPEELADHTARRTVDCTGRVVIPGLVDCHNHLFQLLGRGLGEGMALWPWLSTFMWPYAGGITREEAVAGVTVGALEAARSGTTCVVDNHYAPSDVQTVLAVAAAVDEVGLRGVIARGMTGEKTQVAIDGRLSDALFRYSDEEEVAMTQECIAARRGTRVEVWPAPLNVIYNTQDLVRQAVELARAEGTRWHTHCSEAEADPQIYLDAYGVRPIQWLHQEGLLGPEATIAHAIWLDDAEVAAVGETRTGLSYNPQSNQYLASGAMRLRDTRAAGATVGMGADGSAGHCSDMFQVMKQAVYVQRLATLDPEAATAREVFALATRGGAQYAGLDAGQVAVGRLADLAVVDVSQPRHAPLHDVVSTLVYSCTGSDVTMTIVDGEVVYEDGRATRVDAAEAVAEAEARGGELARRVGLASRLAER